MKRAILLYGGGLLLLAGMAALFYALSVQSAWESSGLKKFPPEGQYLDAGGGRRLRVWCHGVGSPGVVLEASGLGGADQYRELLPQLSRYTRVCAYDRAGMGYSEPLQRAPRFQDYLDDLGKVAERTGPPPYILAGASYGGLLVQAWARQHPEQTGALVLLDAVTPDAFGLLEAPWSKIERSTGYAESLAKVGLLRREDPLKLGADTQDAWLVYRARTWGAVRQLVASRGEAKELFATLPPLPADLPLRVLRHTRVGDLLGPDFSLEEHEALEPEWVKLQEKAAAWSEQGKLVAVERAGHLIVEDAPELVKDTVVELMMRVAERKLAQAAADGGVSPHAATEDAGTADAGAADAGR